MKRNPEKGHFKRGHTAHDGNELNELNLNVRSQLMQKECLILC